MPFWWPPQPFGIASHLRSERSDPFSLLEIYEHSFPKCWARMGDELGCYLALGRKVTSVFSYVLVDCCELPRIIIEVGSHINTISKYSEILLVLIPPLLLALVLSRLPMILNQECMIASSQYYLFSYVFGCYNWFFFLISSKQVFFTLGFMPHGSCPRASSLYSGKMPIRTWRQILPKHSLNKKLHSLMKLSLILPETITDRS